MNELDKLSKFKDKVDNLVIGKYGSNDGFGTNIQIKKYSFKMDDRGEDLTKTLVSTVNTRGVIVDLNYDNTLTLNDLVLHKNDLRIIIPSDVAVESDATHIYELTHNGSTYDITPINTLGKGGSLTGAYKEIFVTLQK